MGFIFFERETSFRKGENADTLKVDIEKINYSTVRKYLENHKTVGSWTDFNPIEYFV